ncbi:MAG: hypothetical protein WBA44_06035 [Mesorhizobium sp.]
MSLMTATMIEELTRRYTAPDRHYHDLRHIEALLALLDRHRDAFADPQAVEAAIWFHDAIYDSRAKDNEERSAQLAAEWLASDTSPARLSPIVRMIEATAGHRLAEGLSGDEREDTRLFLDMDLSILGAEPERYCAYEDEVRREYGWVDDATWRARRADFLVAFLARDRLFSTDLFRDEFEAKARRNMAASLARLRETT